MTKIFTTISIIIIAITGIAAIQKEDGRAGATGSPGETTCNTSQCHTGNVVNNGLGSIVIDAPTLVNWEYVPGTVYPISVTVSKTGSPLFGIGFEALRSTGANGGTLTITNSTETQLKSAFVSPNARTNVVHKLNAGLTPNSHTFSFNWTAPATGSGPVTFYAAGNAANHNGQASGDFIYTTSQVITEFTQGLNEHSSESFLSIYPNPAVNDFQLSFDLSETSFVTAKIVDLTGKTIKELVAENMLQGEHTISNQNNVAISKGIYFVVVEFNNQHYAKKIAIL